MKRIFWMVCVFLSLSLFVLLPVAQADDIKVDSRITDVTIYPGAVLVTRKAELDMPAGDHTLILENIIPQIDENTLTVKGGGSADVKIFGAFIKTENLIQSPNERVKALQEEIEKIDDQIVDQNNKVKILNEQRAYVDSIKLFTGQQIPKDLVTKTPSVTDLDQLGQYVLKSYTDLETQQGVIRKDLRVLDFKKQALANDLGQLNANASKAKHSIAVDVQCVHPGRLTLAVSYYVEGASWQPVYDARVYFEKKQVDLSLFGLVSQSTGEDWNNVNLIISTQRPSLGGVMPELSSWWLSPLPPPQTALTDQFAPNIGNYKAAKVVYAQTEQTGVSAIFKITRPVTIKSDGTTQRVPITALNLPADFEYASTPKLSLYTYLKSTVANNQKAILLPGLVNVFLDGNYVGQSSVNKALGVKEKFDLYLGVDEGVSVKRELIEEKSEDVLFANIPSPNKVSRYSYKISVENYKTLPITLNLFDQIPVSTDKKINVKDVKYNPDPAQRDYKDRKSVMLWQLKIEPGQKKEIFYSFAVERPRNVEIGIQ